MALPQYLPREPQDAPALASVPTAPKQPAYFRPWTYERYCAIPDDGYRYEVIWGELYVVPSPNEPHQYLLTELVSIFHPFAKQYDLGKVYIAPFDVLLFVGAVVQPDMLFVRKERLNIVTGANVRGAPDLVVELLSPSTAARDRGKKADAYAAAGVPHYWIFSPTAHTLEVYELGENGYALIERLTESDTFTPALFPGLSIQLADLWS